MANEDDSNLVAQVNIEGTEAAIADLKKYGKAGKEAFDDLGTAAAKAGTDVEKASEKIDKAASKRISTRGGAGGLPITEDFKDAGEVVQQFSEGTVRNLARIAPSIKNFIGSLKGLTLATGKFAQRSTALAAGVGAAGVAFALASRSIAASVTTQSTAIDDNLKRQTDMNDKLLEGETASINLASSQRQLLAQFTRGEITYADYAKALQQTNVDAREARRVSNELASAQERTTEANDRLKKSADDRKAYQKLTDQFGGPLTSSLVAFGRSVEATRVSIVAAFGPGLSRLVDVFTATLAKNAAAIGTFFDSASKRLEAFAVAFGPQITTALETLGAAATGLFDGLLKAGPALLSLFNDGIVPAVKAVGGFFQGLADIINSVFGTKITGGFLVAVLALAQFSGALKLAFALLRTFIPLGVAIVNILIAIVRNITPLGIAFTVAAVALGYLYTKVDWQAFGANAAAAANTIVAAWTRVKLFFTTLPTSIATGFTTLWTSLTTGYQAVILGLTTAWQGVVTFFTDLVASVFAIFVAFWGILSEGWTAAVAFVASAWGAVVAFFTNLVASIYQGFVTFWNNLKLGFTNVITSIQQTFAQMLAYATQYLQPIIDMLKSIIGLSGTADAGGGQKFARGGHVRGAGTGTSDSIPAWLSNNEFIVKARAVKKYGTGLMNAINSGRFELPAFANGGLVNAMAIGGSAPRYSSHDRSARGGSQQSRTPINLTLDGQTYTDLLAPDEVAARLVSHATTKQVQSAGRRPSWKN